VLDRVDPINGVSLEGPMPKGKATFVAYHQVPLRYGMTIGELAGMYKAERHCNAELTVVPVENWRREAWLDETGLPWTNPSPNMRNLGEAILYPGIGLLESAVSVGRGTDTPFEVVGAPFVNDLDLSGELNKAAIIGVRFIPIQFTPASSVFKGQLCKGVSILVTDRAALRVVDVGIEIARVLYRLYPQDFQPEKMQHLLVHEPTIAAIKADRSLAEIHASWEEDLNTFRALRARYLLY
jgi:uncharacterized protein YbbC (DUF1343 family)